MRGRMREREREDGEEREREGETEIPGEFWSKEAKSLEAKRATISLLPHVKPDQWNGVKTTYGDSNSGSQRVEKVEELNAFGGDPV